MLGGRIGNHCRDSEVQQSDILKIAHWAPIHPRDSKREGRHATQWVQQLKRIGPLNDYIPWPEERRDVPHPSLIKSNRTTQGYGQTKVRRSGRGLRHQRGVRRAVSSGLGEGSVADRTSCGPPVSIASHQPRLPRPAVPAERTNWSPWVSGLSGQWRETGPTPPATFPQP